jgi:hypothetical protein
VKVAHVLVTRTRAPATSLTEVFSTLTTTDPVGGPAWHSNVGTTLLTVSLTAYKPPKPAQT